jgi:hypothetical protein
MASDGRPYNSMQVWKPTALTRFWMVLLAVSALGGCGGSVKKTTNVPVTSRPVALEASEEQLLDRYNSMAKALQSLDATVELKPSTGTQYSGVINEYHEVKAFILASRPYNMRMIGQVPVVGKTVFDMASNGKDFEVSVPSKNKFLVGPVSLNRLSDKPIENLRPQHLVDALLWPEIHKEEVVLPEEYNDETGRYYVLTVLRGGYQSEILSKIWFNRADLHVSRLDSYGRKGALLSDVHYSDWQPPDNASSGIDEYPRTIHIDRPHDDYRLDMTVDKITVNGALPTDRFQLEPPQGAEVVNLSDTSNGTKP